MNEGWYPGISEDDYFDFQLRDAQRFWARIGGMPDLAGERVLDFGCGQGAIAVLAARHGARESVGVDIDEEAITFARKNLARRFGDVADRVEFQCGDASELDRQFDVVVSKDTFEHVADPADSLRLLTGLLAEGGRLYLGFSPLYHSPRGDHGRAGLPRIPWLHVLVGQRRIFRRLQAQGRDVHRLEDLGLNGLTAPAFMALVDESPLAVESLLVNRSEKRLVRALDMVRRFVPALALYTTVSIYLVARRVDDAGGSEGTPGAS